MFGGRSVFLVNIRQSHSNSALLADIRQLFGNQDSVVISNLLKFMIEVFLLQSLIISSPASGDHVTCLPRVTSCKTQLWRNELTCSSLQYKPS